MKRRLLKELEYLSEIAKYENLSQAARELNVTQSALSQCLAGLEADLGMALFSRVKNRLRFYNSSHQKIFVKSIKNNLYSKHNYYLF